MSSNEKIDENRILSPDHVNRILDGPRFPKGQGPSLGEILASHNELYAFYQTAKAAKAEQHIVQTTSPLDGTVLEYTSTAKAAEADLPREQKACPAGCDDGVNWSSGDAKVCEECEGSGMFYVTKQPDERSHAAIDALEWLAANIGSLVLRDQTSASGYSNFHYVHFQSLMALLTSLKAPVREVKQPVQLSADSTHAVLKHLKYRKCDDEYYLSRESLAALKGELLAIDIKQAAYPTMRELSKAAEDVIAERKRQIEKEGWTPEHDFNDHNNGELACAAACYALWDRHHPVINTERPFRLTQIGRFWPWDNDAWKPKALRRNLVRAAALLLAELERIDADEQERRG